MRFTPIEKSFDDLRMFAGTLNRRLAVDRNNSIVLFKIEKQVDDFLLVRMRQSANASGRTSRA